MTNFIAKIFCTTILLCSHNVVCAQTPQIKTVTPKVQHTSIGTTLEYSPFSFDFQNIEIGITAQLIETVRPMDIVFAPGIDLKLTSPVRIEKKSLFDILDTVLKQHQLTIRILDRDLFWIEHRNKANVTLTFARDQQSLPSMQSQLCPQKTISILKQLNAQHIQHDLSDGAEEQLGKGDRIRGQINHQQVQIYCMDQSQKVSARIIVVGQDKNKVKHTFNQISQAYKQQ